MYKFIIILAFIISSLYANSIKESARKSWAHLLIRDQERAYEESRLCLQNNPDAKLAFEMYLHCLARVKDESFWLKEWHRYKELYKEEAYAPKLLEAVAWATLERAKKSSSGQVRQLGLIGAGLTRDVRSVPIIIEGLKDPSSSIRELAVELAALYGDSPLKKAIAIAYEKENIRKVRIAMIRAFGKLHMHHMLEPLMKNLENQRLTAGEQQTVIETIVLLTNTIAADELVRLAKNERSSHRILATQVIVKCDFKEKGELLWELVQDPRAEVSASALKALGILRIEKIHGSPIKEHLAPYLNSTQPLIAITASWLAKINGDERGDAILTYWIEKGEGEIKAITASAVAALGSYGIDLAESLLEKSEDTFVQLNLALALIGQRKNIPYVCDLCAHLLQNDRERWMVEPVWGGLFLPIKKSNLLHKRTIAHYPELASQVIKLQIVSLLAILEYPEAQALLKGFLENKSWQLTGLAAELLLEEGDEQALTCVRALLQDSDPRIVLEAAIVLAVWGRDVGAIPILIKGYHKANIETKVKILEAISRIKDKSTIPFLVECLGESSNLLRIITASVLVQTMNH